MNSASAIPATMTLGLARAPRTSTPAKNLTYTDVGVAKARRLLRSAIRSVAEGNPVSRATDGFDGVIPTYGGDTMLHIPVQNGRDDGAILKEVSYKVAEIYMSGDDKTGRERAAFIKDALQSYEASWV